MMNYFTVMMKTRNISDDFTRKAIEFKALAGADQRIPAGPLRVLVTTHTSPDGDAIASLLTASEIIRLMGGEAISVLDSEVPERFRFLPGSNQIVRPESLAPKIWDCVAVVDAGNLDRIGQVSERISPDTTVINVDHHPDNLHFGKLNIVYAQASSTTELLFDLVQALELPVTAQLSTLLYTGLMTDTGGFRFSNTTEGAFSLAARLTKCGANPCDIAQAVFSDNSLPSLKLLGEALDSLELTDDGRVASMTVEYDEKREEMEELADYALAVKGVQAAALFRVGKEVSRISLRGRGSADVGRIARRFGGGGHKNAAGFTYRNHQSEIQNQIINALREEIESSNSQSPGPA